MSRPENLLFYDGHCILCSGEVQWLIKRDKRKKLHFSALQSNFARTLLGPLGIEATNSNTLIFLQKGELYFRSNAVLRTAIALGGGWELLRIFLIIPAFMRDPVYRLIARLRFRIWGRQEKCMLLVEGEEGRFFIN